MNALIIEDNVDIARIFTMALESVGFNVDHSEDGGQGIRHLMEHAPDLIILDLMMPNVDGEQVLQWMETNPKLNETKVIITSADARRAMELSDQVDMVLMKPVTVAQLMSFSQRMVSRVAPVG